MNAVYLLILVFKPWLQEKLYVKHIFKFNWNYTSYLSASGSFSARLIGMSMMASLVILIMMIGVFGMLFPFISVLAD